MRLFRKRRIKNDVSDAKMVGACDSKVTKQSEKSGVTDGA